MFLDNEAIYDLLTLLLHFSFQLELNSEYINGNFKSLQEGEHNMACVDITGNVVHIKKKIRSVKVT